MHGLGLMRSNRCGGGAPIELFLLLGWVIDAVVELLDRVNEEDTSCELISLVIPKNNNTENVDVPTTAATVKHAPATQMNLNPSVYASRSPPTPAPMICPVTPGIFPRAAVFWLLSAVMKSGSEDSGRPSGSTAAAILEPRLAFSLPTKMALSV